MLHVKELTLSLDIQCDSLCVKVVLMLALHHRIVAFFLFHHIHYELSTIRTLVLKTRAMIYFKSLLFSIYIEMYEQSKLKDKILLTCRLFNMC